MLHARVVEVPDAAADGRPSCVVHAALRDHLGQRAGARQALGDELGPVGQEIPHVACRDRRRHRQLALAKGGEQAQLAERARALLAGIQVAVACDERGHAAAQVAPHHPAVLVVVDELDRAAPTRELRQRALGVPMRRVEQLFPRDGDAPWIEEDRAAVDGEPLEHLRSAVEDVLGAAIRALREAGFLDRQVDPRMAVPERHGGHRAGERQVSGRDLVALARVRRLQVASGRHAGIIAAAGPRPRP